MKIKNNQKGFSTIEILFIIVLVSVLLISGLAIVFVSTKNAEVKTFKEKANTIIEAARNSYNIFKKQNNTEYIVTSEDGTYQGMCITLSGMRKNGFYSQDLNDWYGYVVIEENNESVKYTLWLTDKKYVIDGYESEKIKDLSTKEGITSYEETFTDKLKDSFTGTTSAKGGTNNKTYQAKCIDSKIE